MKSNEILQPNYCMYMYYKIMTSCSSLHSDSIEKLQRRLKVECQRSSATVIGRLQNMCPKVFWRLACLASHPSLKLAADLEISDLLTRPWSHNGWAFSTSSLPVVIRMMAVVTLKGADAPNDAKDLRLVFAEPARWNSKVFSVNVFLYEVAKSYVRPKDLSPSYLRAALGLVANVSAEVHVRTCKFYVRCNVFSIHHMVCFHYLRFISTLANYQTYNSITWTNTR